MSNSCGRTIPMTSAIPVRATAAVSPKDVQATGNTMVDSITSTSTIAAQSSQRIRARRTGSPAERR